VPAALPDEVLALDNPTIENPFRDWKKNGG